MVRLTILLLAISSSAFGATPLVAYPASFPFSLIKAAATDGAGNLYVTGTALIGNGHTGFPVTSGAFQTTFGSRQCQVSLLSGVPKCVDAFVAKFNADGSLAYATYLGGSGDDEAFAISVDTAGNAWVTGYTTSTDFPITANALQKTNAGGTYFVSPTTPPPYQGDAFITGVNAAGSALVYSSFFGGTGPDAGNSIAVDGQGNVYLAGDGSSDILTTTGPSNCAGGFVVKVNPRTPAMVYSTCLPPPVQSMAIDSAGNAYLIGSVYSLAQFSPTPGAFQTTFGGSSDAFVAKLSPDGSVFVYATLLGVNSLGTAIAVDTSGSAWMVGNAPVGFPASSAPAPYQVEGFVARLNLTGSDLLFSTLIAGTTNSILLDQSGNGYVSGFANSPVLGTTPDAFESTACSGLQSFITKWSAHGDLLYSSYSREGPAIAVDTSNNLYILSYTHISDLIGSAPSVVRYNPKADQRQGSIACVTNAASFAGGYVSPGEIISIWGDRLGPDQPAQLQVDTTGKVSTNIGNTRVLFNGVPTPILYADAHQINTVVPWGIAPLQTVTLTIEYAGVDSFPLSVYDNTSTPGVFQINASQPASQGAILNEDGSVNSSSNPAAPGSTISIFCTGMGLVSPLPQDGAVIADTTHQLTTPVPVLFPGPDNPCAFDGMGGTPSCTEGQITYEGAAPTLVAGVIQVNVRLPDSFPAYLTLPGPVPIKMRIPNGPITPVLATVAVR